MQTHSDGDTDWRRIAELLAFQIVLYGDAANAIDVLRKASRDMRRRGCADTAARFALAAECVALQRARHEDRLGRCPCPEPGCRDGVIGEPCDRHNGNCPCGSTEVECPTCHGTGVAECDVCLPPPRPVSELIGDVFACDEHALATTPQREVI